MKHIITLFAFLFLSLPILSDSVRINKTGTTYQNVKTSEENGIITVDFEDGSQKRFRAKDVTVTKSEVIWLAKEEEQPSFWEKWFGGKKETQETSPEAATTYGETKESSQEPSIPYLAEGIFGGVALLFFILP